MIILNRLVHLIDLLLLVLGGRAREVLRVKHLNAAAALLRAVGLVARALLLGRLCKSRAGEPGPGRPIRAAVPPRCPLFGWRWHTVVRLISSLVYSGPSRCARENMPVNCFFVAAFTSAMVCRMRDSKSGLSEAARTTRVWFGSLATHLLGRREQLARRGVVWLDAQQRSEHLSTHERGSSTQDERRARMLHFNRVAGL